VQPVIENSSYHIVRPVDHTKLSKTEKLKQQLTSTRPDNMNELRAGSAMFVREEGKEFSKPEVGEVKQYQSHHHDV
jgi:hypothetical protein